MRWPSGGFDRPPAGQKGIQALTQKYSFPYELKNPRPCLRQVDQYGVDFSQPLQPDAALIAARLGNDDQVTRLVAMGADTRLIKTTWALNAFHIVLEAGVHRCPLRGP